MNIASDYSKLGKMLDLCKGEDKVEIIEKTMIEEGVVTEITGKFNPAVEFTEKDMVSMLFYFGYLTIQNKVVLSPRLKIPNIVMKEIYSDYFLRLVKKRFSNRYRRKLCRNF